MLEAANTTEKTTMFLHENMKRLGLDMLSISRTSANISDTFKTLLKTSYQIDTSSSPENEESGKYFYKSSMEVFSAYAAHM